MKHLQCVSCWGVSCDFATQCEVCKEWSGGRMEDYVIHRSRLVAKYNSKAKTPAKTQPSSSPLIPPKVSPVTSKRDFLSLNRNLRLV